MIIKNSNENLAKKFDQVVEKNQYEILGRKKLKFDHKSNRCFDYYNGVLITGGFRLYRIHPSPGNSIRIQSTKRHSFDR